MRKTVATAFLAGSLLAGGAIGSALFGAGAATAQSSSSDSSSSQSDAPPSSDAPPAFPGGPRGFHDHHHGPDGARPNLSVAAGAIGVTEDELRTALQSGQSIADVATAHGVDPQTVIDAMVADAKAKLAEHVANGELTQEQADHIAADLEQHITDIVNHAGGPGGGPGCPNMGNDSGSSGSNSSSSTAPSTQGSSFNA